MGIENFIKDALYKPNDYIAYHVGRELAELHPGKAIIEGKTGYFDLEAFVRAEKCSIVEESDIFNHVRTWWDGPAKDPRQYVENSWLNVLWRGQLLDVLLITWSEDCYRSRHHWVVAESRKLAEDFFAEVCEWSSEVRGEILVFQDGEWEKNKELYEAIKTATFENVILPDSLKQQVQNDFEQFFRSREVYEQYGIPWKRGALLIGPPGNGKTHTVKALINQLGRPCLYVKGFKSEYATEQENMGAVFARARMSAPCLMVLEDVDAMIDDDNRSFFLNELDGFESNTGLVVLATTNHPDRLDPAILNRPSRFDRKYYFNLPAAAERFAYVVAWNNPKPVASQRPSVRSNRFEVTQVGMSRGEEGGLAPAPVRTGSGSDRITGGEHLHPELRLSERAIKEVVEQTENFSFAYMKELFLSATMQWMSTRTEMLNSTAGVWDSGSGAPPSNAVSDGRPTSGAPLSMDEIVLEQTTRLRDQITALSASASSQSPASSVGRVGRAVASVRRFMSGLLGQQTP